MSIRTLQRITVAYIVAATIALVWPGVLPFSGSTPHVLGLPFSIFWVASWALLGCAVMAALERAVSRAEDESDPQ